MRAWETDGSVVKSACCSCRELELGSQNRFSGSQLPIILVPGESDTLFCPPRAPTNKLTHTLKTKVRGGFGIYSLVKLMPRKHKALDLVQSSERK